MDFQEAVFFLQKPPTGEWRADGELAELLSRAHQHRVTFAHAGSHLSGA